MMLNLFLFIRFSICQKKVNDTTGFWDHPKIKEIKKTQVYQQISSFLDSNITSTVVNDFRNSLKSYKRSYLIKHEPKYVLHKSKNLVLRKVWSKATEMKKKGEKVPDVIKKVLSSFKPQNKLDNIVL